jgi:excinuclease ABC subunit A
LGPEGGDAGGHIVAVGTPEDIAAHDTSYTGHYLREALHETQRASPARAAQRKRA